MVKMSFEVSQAELTEASHKAHVRVFNLGKQKKSLLLIIEFLLASKKK